MVKDMNIRHRMPENALIDDEPPQASLSQKKNKTHQDPNKAAPSSDKKPGEQSSNVRRMSIPGLLVTNNKSNCKKERRSLLGRLSDDLEYLEGLLQVHSRE